MAFASPPLSAALRRPPSVLSSAACRRRAAAAADAPASAYLQSTPHHLDSLADYEALYARSIDDPDAFWSAIARKFHWETPWPADAPAVAWNFDPTAGPVYAHWWKGGRTNICYNALDVHVAAGRGADVALLFEPNEPADGRARSLTYAELLEEVTAAAAALTAAGVRRGDGVVTYMPMGVELPVVMLAAARIGAVHSVWVDAEDPLFCLFTSGSTGAPKGVVHTVGGYMVGAATTFKYSFNYMPGDVYFCTADAGWITGHTYVTYGPLLNGATQVVFEGVPTYPDAGRLWEIVAKYRVNILYTAPTALRSLKRAGDAFVAAHDTSSLKVLGTVGEPINPEAWDWYYSVVGASAATVVDSYWQTETGAHVLAPIPVAGLDLKPGCAQLPHLGIVPVLLDDAGGLVEGEGEGYLAISRPWPSALRTLLGDHERMEATYFARFPGFYLTGDGARRDADGHLWLTGRIDDVLNVSGHRLGTAEVEAAIVGVPGVAEAAVVGVPHPVTGEALYAYVVLMPGVEGNDALRAAITAGLRARIGPIARVETLHWVGGRGLPKTRSGKILRRLLRLIAMGGGGGDLGDTSTLADPSVLDELLQTS